MSAAPLLLAGLLLAGGLLVLPRPRPALAALPAESDGATPRPAADGPGPVPWLVGAAAGALAWVLVGGLLGAILAVPAAAFVGLRRARRESPALRRRRERERQELPQLVGLTATAVGGGLAPASAVGVAAQALPGPMSERLLAELARLELGADPASLWLTLGDDPILGVLARALHRASESGASVQLVLARLADDLDRQARADVEQRARAVGVRAAVPLGACLLPSFLLLGIVPLVAGLLSTVAA